MTAEGVSVVIPHYGDPAPALALVERLRSQESPSALEIVVVDDASPIPFPAGTDGVEVVRRERNGGFGAAVNTGAARARHPLLLVLNSDLVVGPSFLRDLLEAGRPWLPAVVAPDLVDAGGERQWVGRRFPRPHHYVVEWLTPLARWRPRLHAAVGHDTRCTPGATVPVDWVVGAVMLLPVAEFRAVGGFDESFHMNCEEVDLQRRLRERGVPSVFAGSVVAEHTGGGSSDPARRLIWLVASRLRYARKWGGRPAALAAALRAASAVNLAANAVRAAAGSDVRPLAVLRRELRLVAAAEAASR
ncbi:glycosyltransferase [Rathayibacter sp. VKM Ac-2762]|uniref:glycosyltransferase family 2 protein n=1 Tax=Rathayibacter sp. VKM Ac-2762 TaxID=2609254 RepID=UPI00132E7AB1|nr:glycosyltransferase family 2 protein [Rathayibacter sp. VKM Ac-2762]QHF22022.1 glycosyltransferase [Rathayibacter sp. VKM Ac-2762]